ncbi:hypothetical protein ScPMuIL_000292 [Solemya velum]
MSLQSFENDIRKASDEEKVALNDGKDGFLNSNDKFQNVEKMCLHALNSDSNPILTSRKHAKIGCNEVGSNETCLQSSESCEQSESIINVTIEQTRADDFDLEYGVEDNPPVHMCVLFGLQQVLLSISSTISIPMIVSEEICAGHLELVQTEIMSTFLFMCGVCTILQCFLGVRLPIIQGGCHKFIPAVAALMALEKWKCPDNSHQGHSGFLLNSTNADETEMWQSRMREIQGGIIVASLTQVLIGCTGLLGVILQFIGPLTIVPTITLVGLSLVDVSLMFCMKHWGIACLTILLAVLFSLYLRDVAVPVAGCSKKKKCFVYQYPVFKLLPVILAVAIAWIISWILTQSNIFSENPENLDYYARTDARKQSLHNSNWFFMPYPGQWGTPTVSVASFMAMLAATLTSIIESVGDYYACARVSGVPSPPAHAVNRGIAMEGVGSILSGLVGSGGATTSYSQNVGAIAFTKVASRRVFIVAGIIFIICGVVGKIGAFLTMLPQPVLGGIVVVSFGMVTTVGLSNLHFVNMSSGRNMCILGLSLMLGLMIPRYLSRYPNAINTGNTELDQVLLVLLSTSMFVGGLVGFVMDTTVPGTTEERGILKWRTQYDVKDLASEDHVKNMAIYNLPGIMPLLRKCRCSKYIPFLPTFNVKGGCSSSCRSRTKKVHDDISDV